MPFLGKFPTQIVDPEVDIDGGAIDGVTIGATTASAATVTTLTSGNITTTGYIAGPSTFTIDPAAVGDNTGTLVVAGNLQVDGTTTTINSTTMTVDDLNITLASGAANAAAANGAGITVDGASATLTYNSTPDAWSFNKNVGIGTTSPDYTLVVQGDNNINDNIFAVKDSDGTRMMSVEQTSNGDGRILLFDTTGTVKTLFHTAGNSYFNGGNVGIGTTNPTTALHVSGTTGTKALFENTGSTGSYIGLKDSSGSLVYLGDNNGTFEVQTAGSSYSTKLAVTSAGNVGIGNTNPYTKLHVQKDSDTDYTPIRFVSTEPTALITNTTSGALNYASLVFITESNGEFGIGAVQNSGNTASDFVFVSRDSGNRAERARITSNGNLLVGTAVLTDVSSSGTGNEGAYIKSDGQVGLATSNDKSLIINRKTSDGDLAEFRKNGTTVGSIGVAASDNIYFAGGSGGTKGIYINNAAVYPANTGGSTVDNAVDLGSATVRWKDIYLSGGINFSANSNASGMTSELLDDYEEGTWTPVIGGSTGTSGQSYTTQVGNYTKIGRQVIVTFLVDLSNKGTITGDCVLSGLPFACLNTNGSGAGVISYFDNLTANVSSMSLNGNQNNTSAYINHVVGSGATATVNTTAIIGTSTRLDGVFSYFTSA